MKLQIYSNRLSQPCRAIIIFCKLHGIEFEEIHVSVAKGQQFTPEYKVINPMGKLPAIVHGSYKLFESHAILIYLACSFPGVADHWYPSDIQKRAKIHSVLDWHHSNLRQGEENQKKEILRKNGSLGKDNTLQVLLFRKVWLDIQVSLSIVTWTTSTQLVLTKKKFFGIMQSLKYINFYLLKVAKGKVKNTYQFQDYHLHFSQEHYVFAEVLTFASVLKIENYGARDENKVGLFGLWDNLNGLFYCSIHDTKARRRLLEFSTP